MRSRKIAGGYLVKLDKEEEVMESLSSFVAEKRIPCGVLQGIGAVKDLQLGYFDTRAAKYRKKRIRKTVEVLNLTGNISYLDDKPFIHAHITVAGSDQRLLGGHLFRATVAVTMEIYIKVISGKLNRRHDPRIGFNFWDL